MSHITPPQLQRATQCRTDFWELAHRSIAYGIVTQEEVSAIYRPGTRKQGYWCRHLRDLQSIVEERKAKRAALNPA